MKEEMTLWQIAKELVMPICFLLIAWLTLRMATRRQTGEDFVKAVQAVVDANFAEHNKDREAHPDLARYQLKAVCDERHGK